MKSTIPIKFKIASEESELEQIHRMNYRTFVEEIPQHEPPPQKTLVDKFHEENTYIICHCGNRILGMVAVRDRRPFSLDQKLKDLDSYLPPGRSVCEIRLLSIERNHRNGVIFKGLMETLYRYCKKEGYDLAVISGTVRQLKLYRHLGFIPFGPRIGNSKARFQPMYLTLEAFKNRRGKPIRSTFPSSNNKINANLLPGPVNIHRKVQKVFSDVPVSHRSKSFILDFQRTKRLLCDLVGSRKVEILLGSGTLANDAIAAQLSLSTSRGLIFSNGEFGQRLIDHATRFGLSFEVLQIDWGKAFDRKDIHQVMDRNPKIQWVWAVHCETSTGVLNDMTTLKQICTERKIQLCMDCISSIGAVPVDLSGVYLASGVSGKALGAFPGLSMVFHNHKIAPAPKALPRYLDLGYYAEKDGIPFTTSSNLLYALQIALKRVESEKPFDNIAKLSSWVGHRLRELGFGIVASDADASPAVITIALSESLNSEFLGNSLEKAGYLLSYRSRYLLERNWIQICLFGECSKKKIVTLLEELKEFSQLGRTG